MCKWMVRACECGIDKSHRVNYGYVQSVTESYEYARLRCENARVGGTYDERTAAKMPRIDMRHADIDATRAPTI